MKSLEFDALPQEPCVMIKGGIICFYFVDDIREEDSIAYQQEIEQILFAAVVSRPDIPFAAARLSRFNHRPGQAHHEAADRLGYHR